MTSAVDSRFTIQGYGGEGLGCQSVFSTFTVHGGIGGSGGWFATHPTYKTSNELTLRRLLNRSREGYRIVFLDGKERVIKKPKIRSTIEDWLWWKIGKEMDGDSDVYKYIRRKLEDIQFVR